LAAKADAAVPSSTTESARQRIHAQTLTTLHSIRSVDPMLSSLMRDNFIPAPSLHRFHNKIRLQPANYLR
jgi:hypothetical protein